MALVPESLPDSQNHRGGLAVDFYLEPTQLSQPVQYSQQASQGFPNSQIEPRRKYWAILIPTNAVHSILKLPWSKPKLQIGRGNHADVGNDIRLAEKRVSNRHCRISLGIQGNGLTGADATQSALVQALQDGDSEPEVWIEDLKSSNGTFVNGVKVSPRRLLQHGDEISLGHVGTADNHEVRYIFRSVGRKGERMGDEGRVGEVYERYQLLDTLGKGSFAEVKKAVDVETGDLRAIKQIVKHRFGNNPKTLELFQREIDICAQLTHENICRLIEWYEDPQHICLVLEYIDGGDMLDYIMNYSGTGLPEQEAADLTFQICRAMSFCHENGVTHRDLKPENILLTKESETQGRMIKIADFGLAKMVRQGTMLTSLVGTPQYLAPEVVMQSRTKPGYQNVVDSWSVGIIVYSMLTKALPFDDESELNMEQRIRSRYDQPWDRQPLEEADMSDAVIDFIGRLLEKDPEKRMSLTDALNHEWLAGPSSLPNESPSQVLGGDSMWNIQSFDSYNWNGDDADSNMSVDGDADRVTNPAWSRPMTASMTNFESDREPNQDSLCASSADESFSQPMGNLRLNTTVHVDKLTPTRELGESEEGLEDVTVTPKAKANGRANGTPNGNDVSPNGRAMTPIPESIPTESAPAAPATNSSDMNIAAAGPTSSAMDIDTSTTGVKRKAGEGWGSSGSLSPPPPESQDLVPPPAPPAKKTLPGSKKTSPATKKGGVRIDEPERETTPSSEPRRLTRAATAQQGSPATRTRSRAPAPAADESKSAPRARKSMRLQ